MNITLCELKQPQEPGIQSHSPFCVKVHRTLQVLGLPYERRHGLQPGSHKRHNPAGQVPVLLLDGEAIADSTNIVRRLCALRPGILREDAEAWLLEELADTAINNFVVAARWADEDDWARVRHAYFGGAPRLVTWLVRRRVLGALVGRDVIRAGSEACWRRFHTLLQALEARAPDQGFWHGGALSVGDIALFAQLHSLRTSLTPRQRDLVGRQQRLSRYLDRVEAATDRAVSPLVVAAS